MLFLDRIRQDPTRYIQLLNGVLVHQIQICPRQAPNSNRVQPSYKGAPRERYEPGLRRYRGLGNFSVYQAQAQTCYRCRGPYYFINQYLQLQELVRHGFLYINKNNRICTKIYKRLGNIILYLLSDNQIQFLKDQLRQNANINPNTLGIGIQLKAALVELIEGSDAKSEEELGES